MHTSFIYVPVRLTNPCPSTAHAGPAKAGLKPDVQLADKSKANPDFYEYAMENNDIKNFFSRRRGTDHLGKRMRRIAPTGTVRNLVICIRWGMGVFAAILRLTCSAAPLQLVSICLVIALISL
jgi:hypothetical protein